MVATNTVIYDNPSLNVRLAEGKDPIRIVMDRNLRIPLNFNIYKQEQATIIYNSIETLDDKTLKEVRIDFEGDVLSQIFSDLHNRNIQTVIVEGGSRLLSSIIDQNLWDEARIFTSDQKFEKGISTPQFPFEAVYEQQVETDTLKYYLNH